MDTKDWKDVAGDVGAVKRRPPPEKVPPEDDAEMKAVIAAARIRMTRGDESVSVPIKDVAAHKLEGWVIAGQQG